MAVSTRSEFVDFIVPLHDRLELYDRTNPPADQPANDSADPAKAIPQGFIDAMLVREEVFVKEQGVPLENELDEDDARSFHWVAYASIPAKQDAASASNGHADHSMRKMSASTKIPIGTIRLVPPPHPPHPVPGSHHKADALEGEGSSLNISIDHVAEAYVKLGRLAVIKEFRKAGISKLLIETAFGFARDHPYDILPHYDPSRVEALRQESDHGRRIDWNGLVLVHAQTGVEKVWKKYGFERDASMGVWDEEGIDHIGMWKRLDVSRGRRKSKQWPQLTSPLASP